MKKILSLILVWVMLMGLCACGAAADADSPETETQIFQAGFGMANITPTQLGVQLSGYGNEATRLSTGFASYIYAISVAFTDWEGNTAIVMSVDSGAVGLSRCNAVRQWAKSEYGIPLENIIINSLHQHSCPVPSDGKYSQELFNGMKSSIKQAMEDRAPAEIYINSVETESLNFVRRVWANDGTLFTSHSGSLASGFKEYESAADNEMQLLKLVREEKKDILMVNFQCHPHMGTSSSETDVHADWPGEFRDVVSKELDVHCIYVGGAGGNMNSTSYVSDHNITQPKTDFKQHGQRAAKYAINAEDGYTKVSTGLIRCKEVLNTYETDHSQDHLLESAMAVHTVREREGIAEAHKIVVNYPELNSTFQASAIVSKAGAGLTKTCSLTVITFGEIAFSGHPYEMFDTNGKEVKEGTVGNPNYAEEDQLENPFAMTFVASIANDAVGYIPSVTAFDNGGYERDQTRYARGTGELLVGDALHMLNELHEAN